MTIYLVNIPGISRTDTLAFASVLAQNTYFDSLSHVAIETAYYPPHYYDEIKVDATDFSSGDLINANYLYYYFGGKYYYYFIDKVSYINEKVWILHITLDTIQTYMFDTKVIDGVIERKFIDRYLSDGKINRGYIRENVGNGLFKTVYNGVINADTSYWLMVRCNTLADDKDKRPVSRLVNDNDEVMQPAVVNSTMVEFQLYDASFAQGHIYHIMAGSYTIGSDSAVWPDHDTKPNFLLNIKNAYTTSMFVIPFNALNKHLSINISNRRVQCTTGYIVPSKVYFNTSYSGSFFPIGSDYDEPNQVIDVRIQRVYYSYLHNLIGTDQTNLFKAFKVPALLDTNYIHCIFGTNYCNTIYPVEFLDEVKLYGSYYADIFTGVRYYYLEPTYNSQTFNDPYHTLVKDDNVLVMQLATDNWSNYIANNQSRWANTITAGVQNGFNQVMNLSGADLKYNSLTEANTLYTLARIQNQPYTKGRFQRQRMVAASGAYTQSSLDAGMQEATFGAGVGLINAAGGIVSQALTDINEKHKPAIVGKGGNLTGGVDGNGAYIRVIIETVNNFTECAWYFHKNGYLVNEYVSQPFYLSDLITSSTYNTRKIFNVFKFTNCTIDTRDGLIGGDIKLDICERLSSGIRLWNYTEQLFTSIGDYTYDNIERSAT